MITPKFKIKQKKRIKIRRKIRGRISGTKTSPRLFFRKSNKYLYAQIVNDELGQVIAGISTLQPEIKKELKSLKDKEAAKLLGKKVGEILKEKKVKSVVFDRNFSPFLGRVKVFADTVRESGIKF